MLSDPIDTVKIILKIWKKILIRWCKVIQDKINFDFFHNLCMLWLKFVINYLLDNVIQFG